MKKINFKKIKDADIFCENVAAIISGIAILLVIVSFIFAYQLITK